MNYAILFQLLPIGAIAIGLYCCRKFIWKEYIKGKIDMKYVNRVCLLLVGVILLYIVANSIKVAGASGYLPAPIFTDDPAGELDPEEMFKIACEIHDEHEISPFAEYTIIRLSVFDMNTVETYIYMYFADDLIDACRLMRSI